MKTKTALGIDFGSSSVRILTLEIESGKVLSSVEQAYLEGEGGVYVSKDNNLLARQNPGDYIRSLELAMEKSVAANRNIGIDMSSVRGIGVDATGSTPIPVTKEMVPLASSDKFRENLNAYAWMWKDHTSFREAEKITATAAGIRPHYLGKTGGAYSSEWYWAKIWHCLNTDKEVFDAAYTWIEFSDLIPAILTGIKDADQVKRNVCAAGHKGLYSEEWGGYPDKEFLAALDKELVKVAETLPEKAFSTEHIAGGLCSEWAGRFGMKEGIPVSMGILDAHAGAVGSGIKEGTLIKIIGTSSCDLVLGDQNMKNTNILGVAGVVKDSVLPGYYGIEAGQSAVGDILNWFISDMLEGNKSHRELTEKAKKLRPGQSGLLALDWNNGNRNVLTDPMLSGLIVGQTLQTKDFEMYRALIEATAFGAKRIIEEMEAQDITIDEIVNCGGIAHKNDLFMQIYADVMNKPMKIAATDETVALGAALAGAHAAYKAENIEISYNELQARSCSVQEKVYEPDTGAVKTYEELYENYKLLHDAFGIKGSEHDLYDIMKNLKTIAAENH
jgi:L-ribulokinase